METNRISSDLTANHMITKWVNRLDTLSATAAASNLQLVQSSECIGMKGEISEVVIIIDKVIDYYMC